MRCIALPPVDLKHCALDLMDGFSSLYILILHIDLWIRPSSHCLFRMGARRRGLGLTYGGNDMISSLHVLILHTCGSGSSSYHLVGMNMRRCGLSLTHGPLFRIRMVHIELWIWVFIIPSSCWHGCKAFRSGSLTGLFIAHWSSCFCTLICGSHERFCFALYCTTK